MILLKRRQLIVLAVAALSSGAAMFSLRGGTIAEEVRPAAAAPETTKVQGADQPTVAREPVDPSARAAPVPEPDDYRMDDYRKPVPATLKGAKVVSPEEASDLWAKGSAVFIDVYPHAPKPDNLPAGTLWREPQHFSIEGATWLANTGYGKLAPETEEYFKKGLERLSGGDKAKPLVFYCLRNCWMSWNAGKRALAYGYTNVLWFAEGTDAWQELGQPVSVATPAP